MMSEEELAALIGRSSSNPEWQLVGRFWEKIENSEHIKRELLKIAQGVNSNEAPRVGMKRPGERSHKWEQGDWIQPINKDWVGEIVSVTKTHYVVHYHSEAHPIAEQVQLITVENGNKHWKTSTRPEWFVRR